MIKYAEDYKEGDVYELGEYVPSEKEIIDFARKYDPFPFHINDQEAKKTIFGGLISSGWMTALIWLGMMHKRFLSPQTTMGSPGHEEMIWPTPVRPGDTLSGKLEILESRISKSKPELGFVRYKAVLTNQTKDEVFRTISTIIISSRPN
jgi:acyl dehydratase